jgi:hypothetical protein
MANEDSTGLYRPHGADATPDIRAWREGVELALDMIDACDDLDEMSLQADCRDGRPQLNACLPFIQRLREIGDERVEAAFASVLTEVLASREEGSFPDTTTLEQWTQWPVPMRMPSDEASALL